MTAQKTVELFCHRHGSFENDRARGGADRRAIAERGQAQSQVGLIRVEMRFRRQVLQVRHIDAVTQCVIPQVEGSATGDRDERMVHHFEPLEGTGEILGQSLRPKRGG